MNIETLITPSQAARMLNKTNMTIYRWIKSGKISSVVIAGKIFINPANIQNMTKKGETA